jgi:hypothetical protein
MSESSVHPVIEKVRRALGRTGTPQTPPAPPEIVDTVARLVHSNIGLAELFETRAIKQHMVAEPVSPDELPPSPVGTSDDASDDATARTSEGTGTTAEPGAGSGDEETGSTIPAGPTTTTPAQVGAVPPGAC